MNSNITVYTLLQHHQWNKLKQSGLQVTEVNVLHNDIIKYTHNTIYIADHISGKIRKL